LSAWDYKAKGMLGNFGHILFENVNLRQSNQDYTYTEPFLFRISGKHKSVHLKNIYYYDPADNRYVIYVEGHSDIPDIGDTPAEVESLVIDGLHIQDDAGRAQQERPYVKVAGHIKNMIVRNSHVLASGQEKPVTFVAVDGDLGKIDTLSLYQLHCENVGQVVNDGNGHIGQLLEK
jgi:hypothetical protein